MNEGKIWIAAKEGKVSDSEADTPFQGMLIFQWVMGGFREKP